MAAVLGVSLAAHDLTISFSISTGNEAVSGVEDYLEYVLEDPSVRVVTMIIEQFRQPKRFLDLARRAREVGKPIVLLHPGRSSAARESAATHTGAMAGDYQVMRSLVARTGVVIVDALEELLDVSDIALRCTSRPQGGCGVLTESGAFKALTLDLCEQVGLELSPLNDAVRAGLRAVLPDFIPASNPMDLTAQALVDPELYQHTLAVLLGDDSFGSVVLGLILTDKATSDLKLPSVIGAIKKLKPTKPVIFAGLDDGADVPQAYIDELRSLGIPCFPSAERAFRAVAHLSAAAPHDPGASIAGKAPAVLAKATGVIPEYRAKEVLAELGVAMPKGRFARTLDEAFAAAEAVSYPVVLKAQAAELSHKSDAGGVVLNLADADALRDGWARLHDNIARARPGLVLDGVLIEGMGKRGVELIVGARNDRDWGPVLLVGMGGVMAELLHDARLIPANLPPAEIAAEMLKLKCSAAAKGIPWRPASRYRRRRRHRGEDRRFGTGRTAHPRNRRQSRSGLSGRAGRRGTGCIDLHGLTATASRKVSRGGTAPRTNYAGQQDQKQSRRSDVLSQVGMPMVFSPAMVVSLARAGMKGDDATSHSYSAGKLHFYRARLHEGLHDWCGHPNDYLWRLGGDC
jgi:acyl-CoA synthetase (NDP forming)